MKKLLCLSLISLSTFTLLSCTKEKTDNNNTYSSSKTVNSDDMNTNNIENNTSDSKAKPSNGEKIFLLIDNFISPSPFIFKDSVLFFPNWDDNNRISSVTFPDKTTKFTNKEVGEFFDYSTNSMTLFQNQIFFANGNSNYKLSKLNLTDKSLTILNERSVRDLCNDGVRIYYADYTTNELFSYDPIENISKQLTSNKIGKFIVNGNNVIYQNANDKYKLYRVSNDGIVDEKLTDYSVDSFAVYDKSLFFINSSDNNHLYVLNPSDLSTRRIALINGSNLNLVNGTLTFIDQNDLNKLKSIDVNLAENKFSVKTLISNGINDYYTSEKGIFYRKSIDVNSTYYFLPSKK